MTFTLDLIELPKLSRIDGERRLYETPDGHRYPSVTTVLSNMTDKNFLKEWQERIGKEEAKKITNRAATRGTAIHSLCEKLVLNQDLNLEDAMPINKVMFKQVESVLRAKVDNIRLSEGQLYSDRLKLAGSVDLVAEYDSVLSVIDFKTSGKNKRVEWIDNYFLQTSLYAYMLWERTGILIQDIVIIIAIEEEDRPQVFKAKVKDWIPVAIRLVRDYHKLGE